MSYTTVRGPSSAELVAKRSRFIADVLPVSDEAETRTFIASVRGKHPGARHHVFAYALQSGARRCSDDGEPQGTAGQPVLNVLDRRGLVNVAVVVTRYFGGVLLGAPGLLRAYTQAASLALDAAEPVVMRRAFRYRAMMDYSLITRVQQLVAAMGGRVGGTDYGEHVTMELVLFEEDAGAVLKALGGATNGAVTPVLTGEEYLS